MFDVVRRVGGYLFFHTPAELPDVWSVLRFYPHGWHLTAGILDGFVRSSSGELGTTVNAFAHYSWFLVCGYAGFALVLFWAVQWVAGPTLAGWRQLPVLAVVGVFLLMGEFAGMVVLGHPSEILGLTFVAVLVAIVTRPVHSVREQLALITFCLVGLGFCHYLFLPPMFLAALIWAWRYRSKVLRHRLAIVLAAVATAVLAPVAAVLGKLFGEQDGQLLVDGLLAKSSKSGLIALTAVVLLGLGSKAGRRLRVWRNYRYPAVLLAGLAASVGAYQLVSAGKTSYYFDKTLHA